MSLIETARKLLAGKNPPARVALEKALAQARAEHEHAAKEAELRRAERRNILLSASDDQAATHDAAIAKEERARDRAVVLIEELTARLAEVAESERREAIVKERQTAESQIAASLRALEQYPALAEQMKALVATVESGEKAAREFNAQHPDEAPIAGPEARVRWIAPSHSPVRVSRGVRRGWRSRGCWPLSVAPQSDQGRPRIANAKPRLLP